MTQKIFILILTAFTLTSCQTKQTNTNNNNKAMPESTKTNNPYYSHTDTSKVDIPDSEWKKILPDDVYQVARNKATDSAFTGKYWIFKATAPNNSPPSGNLYFRL